MSQKFKDVTISGREYRIDVFSPTIGSMTLIQLPQMLTNETIYEIVRVNCLDVVSVYIEKPNAGRIPMKMFRKADKKWLIPGMEELDPGQSTRLMMEVISFNLDPFMGQPNEQNDSEKAPLTPPSLSQTA